MAQYRHVYTCFWEDPKIVEHFTPEDKLFFIYLLTNPHTSQIGIYKITKKLIAFELGYSIESVNSLMDRFQEHHKIIKYNTETRELAIKNWGKFNLNNGGKPMVDCINKEFKDVEDKSLIAYVAENIKNTNIRALFVGELKKYSDNGEEVPVENTVPEVDDTFHDTANDSFCLASTKGGQKENKKEKENKNIYNQKAEQFLEWYSLYPNPWNKEQSFRNFQHMLKKDTFENLMVATKNYIAVLQQRGNSDKQYITRSTNFIGQKKEYLGYLEMDLQEDVKSDDKVGSAIEALEKLEL